MQDINIHISLKTILKLLTIVLVLYILFLLKDLVLLVFVALILAALVDPFANWFQKKKIPRTVSVLVLYVVLLSLLALLVILLAPVIVKDLPQLVDNIQKFWVWLQDNSFWQHLVSLVQTVQQTLVNYGLAANETGTATGSGMSSTVSRVFSTISGFFGGFFSLVIVLVLAFYLVVQKDSMRRMFEVVIPNNYLATISDLLDKVRDRLGSWIRGQIILSLIVGLLVFLGLTVLGVKYAVLFAILAAILEFIPYLGPIIASVPALLLAFSQGGLVTLLLVALVYFITHELESNLLVPKVMQKTVGLNPIVSILSILAAASLAGVLGAFLAIPVATTLSVIIKDVLAKKTNN